MRGEHHSLGGPGRLAWGASPRARGARRLFPLRRNRVGIIPACAGSTWCWWLRRPLKRDHPRVRGEHGGGPARGGAATDHPRVRGEHLSANCSRVILAGSSPRARGARRLFPVRRHRLGIIPACAGSTMSRLFRARIHGDHPRVRGEHSSAGRSEVRFTGSSPRARGAPGLGPPRPDELGIIPACAGSTFSGCSPGSARTDHPRVRGEHNPTAGRLPWKPGSSPRARGAPLEPVGGEPRAGIIPACAGSTSPA